MTDIRQALEAPSVAGPTRSVSPSFGEAGTNHDSDSTATPITPDETSSQTDIYLDANEHANERGRNENADNSEMASDAANGLTVSVPSGTTSPSGSTGSGTPGAGASGSGVSSLNQACGVVSYAVLLKKDAQSLSSGPDSYAASESSRNSSEKQDSSETVPNADGSNNTLAPPSLNCEDLSRKSSFTADLFPESEKTDLNGDLHKSVASTSSEGRSSKKRKQNWYSVLSPNYKSKCEDFKRLFKDIPGDERLIVDYSCALQKDILVHGRLYITQNWICFYANIFRWETQICIRCRDITAMTKEKTARVIPNAIQIITKTEKLFFTSFGARDKTYLMLFRVWQNALMEQPMVPQEMWQWVHYSYGEELGLTSSDDDYIAPSSENDKASDTPHSPPDSSLPMPAPELNTIATDIMMRSSRVMKSVSPKLLKRQLPLPEVRVEDFAERRSSCPAIKNAKRELTTEAPKSETRTTVKGRSLSPQPQKRESLHAEEVVKRSVSDPDISIVWSPIIHRMGHGHWDTLTGSRNGLVDVDDPLLRDSLVLVFRQNQVEGRRGKTVASIPVEDLNVPAILDEDGLVSNEFDPSDNVIDDLPTDLSDNTDCSDQNEVTCTGHDHAGLTAIDEVFDMTVDEMFTNLFTNAPFYINFQNAKNTTDLELTDWAVDPDADGQLRRVITYTLTLNNPLGPKNAFVREEQSRLPYSKPGVIYIVDCEVNNSGVPYADNFYVVNRYCMTKSGSNRCRLRVSCQIKYRKNVWGVVRTFIDKNVMQGITEHFNILGPMLRKECIDKNGGVVQEQHVKKRLRRRRRLLSEMNQSPSRLPDVATVTHVSARVTVPTRRNGDDTRINAANVESQLKIFSIVLLVLILLNIVLYYNVCMLEIGLREGYPLPANVKLPEDAEGWGRLLQRQHRLHESEVERWKNVIDSSIVLVEQVSRTLQEMKSSLDRRTVVTTGDDKS